MYSLNHVVDFDTLTFQQKKSFVEDILNRQFALSSSHIGTLCRNLFKQLVGNFTSVAIQRIVIPQLIASVDVNRVASELRGQMTLNQVCDFIVSTIEFFKKNECL